MKKYIMALAVAFSSVSYAGPRIVGNGGLGVEVGSQLYMLDLFERGVHQQPYQSPNTKLLNWVAKDLAEAFYVANLEDAPLNYLHAKISEIAEKNYGIGFSISSAIKELDWRLVDAELSSTEDLRSPLIGLNISQVAVRQHNVVYISSNNWKKMDDANKAALILHEAAYYLAPLRENLRTENASGQLKTYFANSIMARSLTGLFFTKRFAEEGITSKNTTFDFNDDSLKDGIWFDKAPRLSSASVFLGTQEYGFRISCKKNNCNNIKYNLRNWAMDGDSLVTIHGTFVMAEREIDTRCKELESDIKFLGSSSSPVISVDIKAIPVEVGFKIIEYPTFNGETQTRLANSFDADYTKPRVPMTEFTAVKGSSFVEQCKKAVIEAKDTFLKKEYSFQND